MRLRRFLSGTTLLFLAVSAAGCQSASMVKPPVKTSTGAETLDSLQVSTDELEALLTLLQELQSDEKSNLPPSFPELEARKERATTQMGILLLASCLKKGEDISGMSEGANPPCVSHGISQLIDPTGSVEAHCSGHDAIETFVSCAAGGIMISRMKSYMRQDVAPEDWSDPERQMKDVAHDLAGQVVNGCLKASKGISDCIVREFADALDVADADIAYCRKQPNLSNRLDCLGAAAAVGLLENGAAIGS